MCDFVTYFFKFLIIDIRCLVVFAFVSYDQSSHKKILIMNSLRRLAPITRNFSLNAVRLQSTQSNELVLVEVNDKTGISTVNLNRPPVNSLNLELLAEFSKTLDELKKNKSRGVILTSVSGFLLIIWD